MRKYAKILAFLLIIATLFTACSSEKKGAAAQGAASTAFTPKLDTNKAVELNAAVAFGNFEALDQVINHFGEFYPNVKIYYEQQFSHKEDFLENNSSIDIFMTSCERGYPEEACLDLKAAGVDVSDVEADMLLPFTEDGKLLSLPMGQTLKGMVVNKSLLEKEGLTVPQTWPEFLNVLEALKQKGYTPIQGPDSAVCTIGYNMAMVMLANDPALYKAVTTGDVAGAAKLQAVFDRILELQEKGYFSPEVDAEYPEDNYDGAIMKFFEGDVPFWVCDTEKVSGMKKRESKSESFTANPFSYEFIYAPLGDDGVYEYVEPWYGFSVKKDSASVDYAVEFLRFMARQDELNTLASIKGVPSVAKETTDARYVGLSKLEKVAGSVTSNGSIPAYIGTLFSNAGNKLISGEITDSAAAVASFVDACTQSMQEA